MELWCDTVDFVLLVYFFRLVLSKSEYSFIICRFFFGSIFFKNYFGASFDIEGRALLHIPSLSPWTKPIFHFSWNKTLAASKNKKGRLFNIQIHSSPLNSSLLFLKKVFSTIFTFFLRKFFSNFSFPDEWSAHRKKFSYPLSILKKNLTQLDESRIPNLNKSHNVLYFDPLNCFLHEEIKMYFPSSNKLFRLLLFIFHREKTAYHNGIISFRKK